jgi:molybdopterin-binding protein
MAAYRLGQVAELLGVSIDTARRWADTGRLPTRRTEGGHRLVEGADLARFAVSLAGPSEPRPVAAESARNHFPGIVTRVVKDGVAAHVEMLSGPHRLVSLMTREAADELELAEGMAAVAAVKSTNVVIELPRQP